MNDMNKTLDTAAGTCRYTMAFDSEKPLQLTLTFSTPEDAQEYSSSAPISVYRNLYSDAELQSYRALEAALKNLRTAAIQEADAIQQECMATDRTAEAAGDDLTVAKIQLKRAAKAVIDLLVAQP